jgi:hypothetical protein
LTVLLLKASADGPCKKCDIEKVKTVNDSINNLTLQLVKDFLCTFDKTCDNNAEFSEWSNETLFYVIQKKPQLFLDAISTSKLDIEAILYALENPLYDMDLQGTYDSLKTVDGKPKTKERYLSAIYKGAQKAGQNLKR